MKKAAQLAAVGGKRKAFFEESEFSTSLPQLKTRRLSPENSDSTAANSTCDHDHVPASSSSCTGSGEPAKVNSKSVDLEEYHQSAPAEFSGTSSGDSSEERREKTGSESELEEFFTAAEENIRKKFVDRYNFDIVKDQPVEGRYEWVQIELNP